MCIRDSVHAPHRGITSGTTATDAPLPGAARRRGTGRTPTARPRAGRRRAPARRPRGLPSALVSDHRTDPDAAQAEAGAPTHWVLSLSCPDRPGIVHAVAGLLAEHGGNITESQQFGDQVSGLFFMRVQVESTASRAELTAALGALAPRFSMCLLYTSDAADDLTRVDLGGRRI